MTITAVRESDSVYQRNPWEGGAQLQPSVDETMPSDTFTPSEEVAELNGKGGDVQSAGGWGGVAYLKRPGMLERAKHIGRSEQEVAGINAKDEFLGNLRQKSNGDKLVDKAWGKIQSQLEDKLGSKVSVPGSLFTKGAEAMMGSLENDNFLLCSTGIGPGGRSIPTPARPRCAATSTPRPANRSTPWPTCRTT